MLPVATQPPFASAAEDIIPAAVDPAAIPPAPKPTAPTTIGAAAIAPRAPTPANPAVNSKPAKTHEDVRAWERFPHLLDICDENPPVGFLSQRNQ